MSYEKMIQAIQQANPLFELFETKINGHSVRDYKNRPEHISEFLTVIDGHDDAMAIVHGNERITYAEFAQSAKRFSLYLRNECNVQRGQKVAIFGFNQSNWLIALWGGWLAGATMVAMNSWWTTSEAELALERTSVKVLVVDDHCYPKISQYQNLDVVIHMNKNKMDLQLKEDELQKTIHVTFSMILDCETLGNDQISEINYSEDDAAIIIFTSGTTGLPKGAVLSHRAWISGLVNGAFAAELAKIVDPQLVKDDEAVCLLATLPFFHVGGGHSIAFAGVISGQKIVIPVGKFDANKTIDLIKQENINRWSAVPAMVRAVCLAAEGRSIDISGMKSLAYGAAPSSPELETQVYQAFKGLTAASNAYGLSEAGCVFTMNTGREYRAKPNSVGRAFLTADVLILDKNDGECPIGELGEIHVKGPFLMDGYWQGEGRALDRSPFNADGYLKTGDIGCVDDEGYVYIKDRLKDVIIRGGENIFAAEVEACIEKLEVVHEAAIIGVPCEKLGEQVNAIIRLKPNTTMSQLDIQQWVGKSLAKFKVPSQVRFTNEALPRNATGKLLKRVMKVQENC